MNIVLIGFRCTGKSTVGRMLADRAGWEFVDADETLEKRAGKTVREIFEELGESYFRKVESEVIEELSRLNGKVIATGGGAVLKRKNIQNLKRNGILVLLDAHPDVLFERVRRDPKSATLRPALTHLNLAEEIKQQYELRRPYYQKAADVTIHTSERPVAQVTEDLERVLRGRGILPHPPGEETGQGAAI